MFMMARMWSEKAPSRPEDFWPLPGDEVGRMTDEDIKQILKAVHAGGGIKNTSNG